MVYIWGGPLVEGHKYSAESVELHSNWANLGMYWGSLRSYCE